jgi:hypothetical protein
MIVLRIWRDEEECSHITSSWHTFTYDLPPSTKSFSSTDTRRENRLAAQTRVFLGSTHSVCWTLFLLYGNRSPEDSAFCGYADHLPIILSVPDIKIMSPEGPELCCLDRPRHLFSISRSSVVPYGVIQWIQVPRDTDLPLVARARIYLPASFQLTWTFTWPSQFSNIMWVDTPMNPHDKHPRSNAVFALSPRTPLSSAPGDG